ncbi:hypothetical protein AQUCO_03500041v1 [Aquilegia coerulea]|uniref:Uncharacterized protein n=1 Tax=Aquilegia coerulea TaxID=218851 RepID=A0A2G5CVR9_AQUCA|nr:hypothetical protein AQUCO_03500041v1 [Aquilegia coerulea]
MLNGLPCGISPHNLFALKFACLILLRPRMLSGIFPVSLLLDKSNHCNPNNFPMPGGINPFIRFLEMSNFSS